MQTDNYFIRQYIDEFLFKKKHIFPEGLIREESVKIGSLKPYEIGLIENHFNHNKNSISIESRLMRSSRALNGKQEYHTFDYDSKFHTIDNHSVEYYGNNGFHKLISYGTIVNFISLLNQTFCILKKMNVVIKNIQNRKFRSYMDKFFIELKETNEYELVKLNHIKRRCIRSTYMHNSIEHIVFSPCIDLNEHD